MLRLSISIALLTSSLPVQICCVLGSIRRFHFTCGRINHSKSGLNRNIGRYRVEEFNIKQAFFIAGKLFSAVVHVKIWVGREERYKSNEFIITRPDISAVVPFVYVPGGWHVLLVSEFRSPVRNNCNMVVEVPSGSSFNPNKTAIEIALAELEEEVGVKVDESLSGPSW